MTVYKSMPQRIFFAKNGFKVHEHKGKKEEIHRISTAHVQIPHFYTQVTRFPINGDFFVSK